MLLQANLQDIQHLSKGLEISSGGTAMIYPFVFNWAGLSAHGLMHTSTLSDIEQLDKSKWIVCSSGVDINTTQPLRQANKMDECVCVCSFYF